MTSRVVLHVGAPKSGTTFLQRALWSRRPGLEAAGVHLPGSSGRDMFHAAIEVRGTHARWGYSAEELAGTWARLCAEARAPGGTTLMSHELLAAAGEAEVAAALTELRDTEVHVVLTARDLARQVLSDWQERIKNGDRQSFGRFAATLSRAIGREELDGLFWSYQHPVGALSRWGAGLAPDRLHVVVAPPAGADPLELWRRFGDAVGYDGRAIVPDLGAGPANPTLGVVQTAVLRGVNEKLDGRIVQPDYARVVKRQMSQSILAAHTSPRPTCPPELLADLRRLSERWVAEVREAGYTVHGDLAELIPDDSSAGRSPDQVDPHEVADVAVAVIADLLVEKARAARRSRPSAAASPAPAPTGAPVPAWRRQASRVRHGVPRRVAAAARRGLHRIRPRHEGAR